MESMGTCYEGAAQFMRLHMNTQDLASAPSPTPGLFARKHTRTRTRTHTHTHAHTHTHTHARTPCAGWLVRTTRWDARAGYTGSATLWARSDEGAVGSGSPPPHTQNGGEAVGFLRGGLLLLLLLQAHGHNQPRCCCFW
eukprot:1145840-Pelagomonas_calceolata.AAC.5